METKGRAGVDFVILPITKTLGYGMLPSKNFVKLALGGAVVYLKGDTGPQQILCGGPDRSQRTIIIVTSDCHGIA